MVRVGTVNAATVPLLVPAVREFRTTHPVTQVEVVGAQQSDIHRALAEGGSDLGLVNHLDGDDSRRVRVHAAGSAGGVPAPRQPARGPVVGRVNRLLTEPLIAMRSGYVMHRCVHRLLDGREPPFAYSADGAGTGKPMVAEGLGVTVLPDLSVIGDPLERLGTITYRPVEGDTTRVLLMLQRRRPESAPQAAQDLYEVLARQARELGGTLPCSAPALPPSGHRPPATGHRPTRPPPLRPLHIKVR